MKSLLMIPCKKAIELMAKNEEKRLSLLNRLKLSLHVSMCAICKMFQTQTEQVAHHCRSLHSDEVLTHAAKEKMVAAIKKQYHE